MTQRKKIGFDLDDVLMDFNNSLCIFHNREYGTTYSRNDIFTFNLEKVWNCGREQAVRRVLDFYDSELHTNILPVIGAVDGILALKDSYDLYIVTAKPEALKDQTYRWLHKHFYHAFKDVYFTNHFLGEGPRRSKGEICRELGIDLFIDDSLENAYSIATVGVPVLLFDTPWNQEDVAPPIHRVKGWEQIVYEITAGKKFSRHASNEVSALSI